MLFAGVAVTISALIRAIWMGSRRQRTQCYLISHPKGCRG
jgi:hypothetical protein